MSRHPLKNATAIGTAADIKSALEQTTLWDMAKDGSPCLSAFIAGDQHRPEVVGLFAYFEDELAVEFAQWMAKRGISWPNPHMEAALALIVKGEP